MTMAEIKCRTKFATTLGDGAILGPNRFKHFAIYDKDWIGVTII